MFEVFLALFRSLLSGFPVVSVTNGWGDGFGLARLPEEARRRTIEDHESPVKG